MVRASARGHTSLGRRNATVAHAQPARSGIGGEVGARKFTTQLVLAGDMSSGLGVSVGQLSAIGQRRTSFGTTRKEAKDLRNQRTQAGRQDSRKRPKSARALLRCPYCYHRAS